MRAGRASFLKIGQAPKAIVGAPSGGGDIMIDLSQAKVVGFVQVADKDRARSFYEGVLGLSLRDDGFALVAEFPGAILRITAIPGYQPPEHPAFGFEVQDARAFAAEAAARGAQPQLYSFLGEAQTPDGVWTGPDGVEVFWFTDADGNVLTATTGG
jgi:catechol 2,3-dioxygenase-like lactoylglutathione lyase family enzyme